MSTRNERKSAAPPAIYLVAALLAAIAGFGTVYWSFAPSDNGRSSETASGAAGGRRPSGRWQASQARSQGLSKGPMAPLVARPEPVDLPDFSFTDKDGGTKSLKDFAGKVVLLNIWATWCVPCREEMPALDKLEAKLGGKDFAVVAVNIDKGGPDKAAAFLQETGVTHLPLYTDPTGKLFATLKAVGMPTTLIIDREGREIARLVGPADWASPEALAVIEAAIAAPSRLATMNASLIDDILRFWFETLKPEDWYRKDAAIDAEITKRFGAIYDALKISVPQDWLAEPKGLLAAILVLDQFPRNMFRDDPRAFATDAAALALAKRAIGEGMDMQLPPEQRAFIYMPFQHSEASRRSSTLDRALHGARRAAQSRLCAEARGDHRTLRPLPPSQCRARPHVDRGGACVSEGTWLVVLTGRRVTRPGRPCLSRVGSCICRSR